MQLQKKIDVTCQIITCVSENSEEAIQRAKKTIAFYDCRKNIQNFKQEWIHLKTIFLKNLKNQDLNLLLCLNYYSNNSYYETHKMYLLTYRNLEMQELIYQ